MIQLIQKEMFQKTLWKNGQGITHQIKIYPEGTSVAQNDFIWRLSQAEVQSDNTFSFFPKCERKLTILEGPGFYINNFPLNKNQVLTFSGEENIQCTLMNQNPVLDLGLIYKKDCVDSYFNFIDVEQKISLIPQGQTDFLLILEGESCEFQKIILQKGDCIQIENEKQIEIRNFHQKPVRLIHIAIKYALIVEN